MRPPIDDKLAFMTLDLQKWHNTNNVLSCYVNGSADNLILALARAGIPRDHTTVTDTEWGVKVTLTEGDDRSLYAYLQPYRSHRYYQPMMTLLHKLMLRIDERSQRKRMFPPKRSWFTVFREWLDSD